MKNRIYNTKAIIESGLITALVVVIMLINVYVPIFSLFGMFILPIPITVLYIRQNYKVTLGAIVISAVLIAMLYDPLSALTSSIMFGLNGITLGYCVKHDKKVSFTLVLLAIGIAIGTIVDMGIYISLIDRKGVTGFINDNIKMMRDSINMSKEIYSKMGVSSEQFAPIEKSLNLFTTDFILKLLPAVLVLTSFISAYLNYIITRSILKKLRYNMKKIKSFNQLYINTRIGTLVGIILVVGLLLTRNKVIIGEYFVISSQLTLQFIFVLDGLSLVSYYLKNKFNMSKILIMLILIFTVFSQISLIYTCIGLADMIFDFRKLDPYRNHRTE